MTSSLNFLLGTIIRRPSFVFTLVTVSVISVDLTSYSGYLHFGPDVYRFIAY